MYLPKPYQKKVFFKYQTSISREGKSSMVEQLPSFSPVWILFQDEKLPRIMEHLRYAKVINIKASMLLNI